MISVGNRSSAMAVTEPKLSVGCTAYLSAQLVLDLPENAPQDAPGLEPVHSQIKQSFL